MTTFEFLIDACIWRRIFKLCPSGRHNNISLKKLFKLIPNYFYMQTSLIPRNVYVIARKLTAG